MGINDDELWSLPLLADFCRFSLPVPASVRAALETGYVYARRRTPTVPQTQMHTRHKCIQAHALYHTGSDLAFPGATVVLAALLAGGTTTDVSPCQVQLLSHRPVHARARARAYVRACVTRGGHLEASRCLLHGQLWRLFHSCSLYSQRNGPLTIFVFSQSCCAHQSRGRPYCPF